MKILTIETIPGQSYEPLDIVLVLDVSGSMDDEIDTYTYKKV